MKKKIFTVVIAITLSFAITPKASAAVASGTVCGHGYMFLYNGGAEYMEMQRIMYSLYCTNTITPQ